MQPLVSVIMPAYNQAAFLPIALQSILSQSYANLEVILMDDGSTDSTPHICQNFISRDKRIRYFRQNNQGPSVARNQAIHCAKGDYICLLDADDYMEQNKIKFQLTVLLENPQVDIVYTALFIIDVGGQKIGEVRSQDYSPNNFLAYMFFRNIIPNPNTIMSKRDCLVHNPYNAQFKHAEDYELMIRLAHKYRFKYLDLPLTSYRRHSYNLSNDLAAHRLAELKVLNSYGKDHIEQVVENSNLEGTAKILLKGKIFLNMELYLEAAEIFKQLDSAIAYFYLGNCYLKMNEPLKAIESYQHSLQLDQTNPACYNNLGVAYFLQKDLQQAKQCFQQALQLKADYLDARYNFNYCCSEYSPRVTLRELRKQLLPYIEGK